MITFLKQLPLIKDIVKAQKDKKILKEWESQGRPLPGPGVFKRSVIRDYSKESNIDIFIETGTYNGGMVEAVRNLFDKVYSIELDEKLYEKAKKRFAKYDHIEILQGDSGKVIKKVLNNIDNKVLFWLDAHYSGGYTARGDEDTPILNELKHILEHNIKDHVILIDDAREFTDENEAYPSIEEVKNFIGKYRDKFDLQVKDDIIRIFFS